MTTATRPNWLRLDLDFLDNPKMLGLMNGEASRVALLLWVDGLCYATRHLTDGWIPKQWPVSRGYSAKHVSRLIDAGLWHEQVLNGDGGWLIHDYLAYQKSRDAWLEQSEQKRAAARVRWERRP